MENTTELAVEDILSTLLDDETAGDLAELEIDPSQMPVAKSSVVWTVTAHC
ncbi:hypothetical protein ABZ383_14540 [Streptomyces sp. NPDC005900]|uniref:hypothetical protein n=1 Tax=unclassified Streptomyces TaxID=2593676 RepID=UPI000A46F447|nr:MULTISPECIES: hypothetical protein [unclassified Streptomyces]